MAYTQKTHTLKNSMYCTCGQDAVTCQACGTQFCGELTSWVALRHGDKTFNGNACQRCTTTLGLSAVKMSDGSTIFLGRYSAGRLLAL